MVKDEDTTPVALRAALLRQDTTPERQKTTKSSILFFFAACICVASLAWHLFTFENAADLRFFGGIGLALDLWLATAATHAIGAPRSNVDLERGFLDDVRGLPLVEDRFRADRLVGRVRDEWRRHLIFTSARLALAHSDLQVSWFLDRTEGH